MLRYDIKSGLILLLIAGLCFFRLQVAGNEELFEAAKSGNKQVVVTLLRSGVPFHTMDEGGNTALHLAAQNGHMNIVTFLLSLETSDVRIVDIDQQNGEGDTPLHLAARNGQSEVVEYLLYRSADPLLFNDVGETAFYAALEYNHISTVNIFLEQESIGVNDQVSEEEEPLHVAVAYGHLELVRELLRQGAGINSRTSNTERFTPLHVALYYDEEDVARELLRQGADVSARAYNFQSVLHVAAQYSSVAMLKLLLDSEVDVNVRSGIGDTVLHFAARGGNVENVRYLLSRILVNAINARQSTALHEAAGAGHVEVVRLLLTNGANVHSVDIGGRTALHEAAVAGHHNIFSSLAGRGANIWQGDVNRYLPFHLAVMRGDVEGNVEFLEFLLSNFYTDITNLNSEWTFLISLFNGSIEVARLLCEHGFNFVLQRNYLYEILHNAARGANIMQTIYFLLSTQPEGSFNIILPYFYGELVRVVMAFPGNENRRICISRLMHFLETIGHPLSEVLLNNAYIATSRVTGRNINVITALAYNIQRGFSNFVDPKDVERLMRLGLRPMNLIRSEAIGSYMQNLQNEQIASLVGRSLRDMLNSGREQNGESTNQGQVVPVDYIAIERQYGSSVAGFLNAIDGIRDVTLIILSYLMMTHVYNDNDVTRK